MGEIGEEDVTQLVPLEVLKSDEEFYEYITLSNNRYIFFVYDLRGSIFNKCESF